MICFGCMNSDRKMIHIATERERECFLQIIKNIPMPVPAMPSLYLCWECTALIVRFSKFKDQVMNSYKILNDIKPQNSFEIENIQKPETHLSTKELFNFCYKPEGSTEYLVEVVKTENYAEDIDIDIKPTILSYAEHDMKIEICRERKRKKKEKVSKSHTKIKKEGSEYKEIELSPEELEEERNNLANKDDFINALYKCEKCIKAFPSEKCLNDHVYTEHEMHASSLICKICECSFISEVAYKYHMGRHTRRYECTVCGERFTNNLTAIRHYDVKHDPGKVDNLGNGSGQREQLEQIRSAVNGENTEFVCTQCGKMFQRRWNLQRHLETHAIREQGGLLCVPCNRSFSSVATYNHHMTTSKVHLNDADLLKFVCAECGERFATKKLLKKHAESSGGPCLLASAGFGPRCPLRDPRVVPREQAN